MIKVFSYNDKQTAIVIRNNYSNEGIEFFTDKDSPQQIGYMHHNKGHKVLAHVHNIIKREISLTQETLVIKKGKIRLDLYSEDKNYIESTVLNTGDVAILMYGGHGLYCLEETEIIEIKQGPYMEKDDKVRFEGVKDEKIRINT